MTQSHETTPADAAAWALALVTVAHTFEMSPSLESTRLHLLASPQLSLKSRVLAAATLAGLNGRFATLRQHGKASLTPFIAELQGGELVVVRQLSADRAVVLTFAADAVLEREVSRAWLHEAIAGPILQLVRRGPIRGGHRSVRMRSARRPTRRGRACPSRTCRPSLESGRAARGG